VAELIWLRRRRHIVREVQQHLSGGLDGWMDDALRFLADHEDHAVTTSAGLD
jgi:hypothetical protein